jgi:hypothetical protein
MLEVISFAEKTIGQYHNLNGKATGIKLDGFGC